MQRVTNCILVPGDEALVLQKPRRGWFVAPGGKMEPGESVRDSVVREYREETGFHVHDPRLRGVFTVVIQEQGETVSEWMMFTFVASQYTGTQLAESPEGELAWKPTAEIETLPMAPGDRFIFEHMFHRPGQLFGTFYYTPDFQLIDYHLTAEVE
ncbi:8-oxo-dGTP diphosphatase [Salsuginibacillus halophilus]|uniref:8-oxo-dGTP diphosphatase n=1 Tax=Salsuginibacillus halophilus TaxID=517424 RepID=A0A2P8HL79_9BACI|nr:8-oxo-dGTP diphosphatase [Salsuginibacillus halophilus]PSL46975.1 8-oxo-dGTP diphosphatase [Salsuginibacillus halophilus]